MNGLKQITLVVTLCAAVFAFLLPFSDKALAIPFTVETISPTDGAIDVPSTGAVRVQFSNTLDGSTVIYGDTFSVLNSSNELIVRDNLFLTGSEDDGI